MNNHTCYISRGQTKLCMILIPRETSGSYYTRGIADFTSLEVKPNYVWFWFLERCQARTTRGESQISHLSRSNQTMYVFDSSRDVRLVLHAGNHRFHISRGQTKLNQNWDSYFWLYISWGGKEGSSKCWPLLTRGAGSKFLDAIAPRCYIHIWCVILWYFTVFEFDKLKIIDMRNTYDI